MDNAPVSSEIREVAEQSARSELLVMEGDGRDAARREFLQDHHTAEIKRLQDDLKEATKENAELKKKIVRTRNTVKIELEAQTRYIKAMLILVLVGLFGTTKPGQDLALLLIQGIMKGLGK